MIKLGEIKGSINVSSMEYIADVGVREKLEGIKPNQETETPNPIDTMVNKK